ncbi:unnamed protein product, partial [Symbiodinium sp. KB8]
FNACGLNFVDNFIYCRGLDDTDSNGNKQLLRLDCAGGTACYLGSLGSTTFAANFDPLNGDYVMTNEREITIVKDVNQLPCLGSPGGLLKDVTTVDTIPQTWGKGSTPQISIADLMVLDLPALDPNFPTTGGQSWLIGCVDGAANNNQVYIQSLTDELLNYFLVMTDPMTGAPLAPNLGGASGAQWQFKTSLFCAYNHPPPGGVYELDLTQIVLPTLPNLGPAGATGTIPAARVSDSDKTNSNDGLN